MSACLPDPAFWRGRRVLLTGHTGFKGAWAALWLTMLGARVHGFALPAEPGPSIATLVPPPAETLGDLRDAAAVRAAVAAADPEIVLHLAAQALVGRGWRDPAGTFAANVGGTLSLLEALRGRQALRAVLVVTSDKVYRNDNQPRAFAEADPLGGDDPYSASKAACEMLVPPLRTAWFEGIGVGVARAGNVIGGGDGGEERLLPDAWRALRAGAPLVLRRPDSTRPWQHVFDCLAGYLAYAERLVGDAGGAPQALNFGPAPGAGIAPAREVADLFFGRIGKGAWQQAEAPPFPEKTRLSLDPAQAAATLGWRMRLDLPEAVGLTADWVRAHEAGEDMAAFSRAQIAAFAGLPALVA
jgi:CDP-glucose 4,6-dehydratase